MYIVKGKIKLQIIELILVEPISVKSIWLNTISIKIKNILYYYNRETYNITMFPVFRHSKTMVLFVKLHSKIT